MDTRKVRTLRQVGRDRILQEMLHAARGKDSSKAKDGASWKVLVLDEVTVKVISKICNMGDIFDEGISVVEDLNKRRQPMRTQEAVYFLHPSRESVALFMEDMAPKTPLYKKAHVFFSMQLPHELLQLIKSSPSVLSRIASLAEINLEFWIVDTQGYITDHESALQQVFGDGESSSHYKSCLDDVASRLATVFASLKELPAIRYRAAPASEPTRNARDNAPMELANLLWKNLLHYKMLQSFPKAETCDLLIVNRSVDPVAPIIHEWTYDAMLHDLLHVDGTKYTYEVATESGRTEHKQVLLEEHDPVWRDVRDLHIADAYLQLTGKVDNLLQNNAAKLRLGANARDNLTPRDMQKIVQALPQYKDVIEKLGLHVHIASLLNDKMKKDGLKEIGKLEQDFVFGGASSKELINILTNRQDLSTENKVRLLMIFAASYPEKMDNNKLSQWIKLARLSDRDVEPISNMKYLGVTFKKKQQGHFHLKFGSRALGGKQGLRKDKEVEEGAWELTKFTPAIQDVVEELAEGKLSKDDYPYLRSPSQQSAASNDSSSAPDPPSPASVRQPGQSARTRRPTWATKSQQSEDLTSTSDTNHSSQSGHSSAASVRSSANGSGSKVLGKRIFVFIIGGMTRSELRVAHKLTDQLKREVIMGSTSLDNCHQFIEKVTALSGGDLDIIDL